jgi:hypothetical protein
MRLTDRRSFVALALFGVMLATSTDRAYSAVNTFTDRAMWQSSLGGAPTAQIDFEGLPDGTPITTQYLGLGVGFSPDNGNLPTIYSACSTCDGNTLNTLNSGQTIRMRFTTPVLGVGWDHPSRDDSHVYQIFDVNGALLATLDLPIPLDLGGPIFGGFTSHAPIGFATSFSPNDDQRHLIDNLTFTVPEPSSLWLCAVGVLCVVGATRYGRNL